MTKARPFLVERFCGSPRRIARLSNLLLPFKILVTAPADKPCKRCRKRAWVIDGRSLAAFERRHGLAHIDGADRTICETAGHLINEGGV